MFWAHKLCHIYRIEDIYTSVRKNDSIITNEKNFSTLDRKLLIHVTKKWNVLIL